LLLPDKADKGSIKRQTLPTLLDASMKRHRYRSRPTSKTRPISV
jgi:hypothetical protein